MDGYKILSFQIDYFKGIYSSRYEWKDGEGLVIVGDHGEGKTNNIEALDCLLDGAKALKLIDAPVYDGMKKYTISADFKGESEDLKAYDVGNLFRITATQSPNGKQQLKIQNLEDGRPVKGTVREILKTLRGLYVDPHQLMEQIKEYNGDRKLADRVLKNIGLDLSEFDDIENGVEGTEEKEGTIGLADQWSAENKEVVRLNEVIASIEIPAEGFPVSKIDVEKLWQESADYKSFSDRVQNKENEQKLLQSQLENANDNLELNVKDHNLKLSEIETIRTEISDLVNSGEKLKEDGLSCFRLVIENEYSFGRTLKDLADNVAHYTELNSSALEKFEKAKSYLEITKELSSELAGKCAESRKKVKEIKEKIGHSYKPEAWEGLQDKNPNEDERLSPDEFISKSIREAQDINTNFAKKEELEIAESTLKTAEQARTHTSNLRKENTENRTQAVANSDFKVNGLSVNENGVLTAQVEGKNPRTLRDLNHADLLKVCCEILMVNNDKPLKLIVIKEGYACRPEYQKVIFDQARKYNYTAIMESFVAVEGEGCLWMKDGLSSDVAPVDLKTFESDHNVEENVKGKPEWS